MNISALMLSAATEAENVLEWNLCSYFIERLGVANTASSGLLMLASVLLCIVVPYLIGSINPAIIFSKAIYHEDIRSYGSGNAGSTNILRTYGTKMAILIFSLDLAKSALAIGFGWFILTRSVGGAIAALFVVLGHMFPIFYKFKGGKGVACTAMCILMLSPITFVILLTLFILIAVFTRFISLGSILCAMLFPFLNYVFYPAEGFITLSAFCIGAMVVFMHRENIKRLLAGKESKFSFKKTDKHAAAEHNAAGEAQAIAEKTAEKSEKEYSDDDFVKCACGRIIPKTREVCAYCGVRNPHFVPAEKKKKGKKTK